MWTAGLSPRCHFGVSPIFDHHAGHSLHGPRCGCSVFRAEVRYNNLGGQGPGHLDEPSIMRLEKVAATRPERRAGNFWCPTGLGGGSSAGFCGFRSLCCSVIGFWFLSLLGPPFLGSHGSPFGFHRDPNRRSLVAGSCIMFAPVPLQSPRTHRPERFRAVEPGSRGYGRKRASCFHGIGACAGESIQLSTSAQARDLSHVSSC